MGTGDQVALFLPMSYILGANYDLYGIGKKKAFVIRIAIFWSIVNYVYVYVPIYASNGNLKHENLPLGTRNKSYVKSKTTQIAIELFYDYLNNGDFCNGQLHLDIITIEFQKKRKDSYLARISVHLYKVCFKAQLPYLIARKMTTYLHTAQNSTIQHM